MFVSKHLFVESTISLSQSVKFFLFGDEKFNAKNLKIPKAKTSGGVCKKTKKHKTKVSQSTSNHIIINLRHSTNVSAIIY